MANHVNRVAGMLCSVMMPLLLPYTGLAQGSSTPSKPAKDSTRQQERPYGEEILYRKNYNLLYGQQPVAKTLQSVAQIGTSDLVKSPVATISNALTGRLPGLYSIQGNGLPGQDGVNMYLRGVAPVIIVDGVVRPVLSIAPEEVASVTVLKDALATAMLGQRASNGAVLITTRKGDRGTHRISFTAQTGIQKLASLPKPLGAYDYARLYNEALANDGKAPVYTPTDLDLYKSGKDPYGHPDVRWYDEILRKQSTFSRYNLNASGGGELARYFVSLDYLNQQGPFNTASFNTYNTNSDYKRYIIRSNIDVNVSPRLNVSLNLSGRIQNTNDPGGYTMNLYTGMLMTPSNAYPKLNPNGSLGGNQDFQSNLYGQSVKSGYRPGYSRDVMADVAIKRQLDDVVKGLYIKGLVSFNTSYTESTNRSKSFAVYKMNIGPAGDTTYQQFGTDGDQANSVGVTEQAKNFYTEVSLGFDRKTGNNNISALVMANRQNMVYGSELPMNFTNLSAHVSYDYKGKYLLEAAASYSGLNRYVPGKRNGFFPSIGIGWNMTDEPFVRSALPWITLLKLRATYGAGGNARAGYFVYNQYYGDSDGYYLGSAATFFYTTTERVLANPGITWEKSRKFNIGLDAAMLADKLGFSIEYYNNRYSDLIQQRGRNSTIIGNTYPDENIGINRYTGVDLQLRYNGRVRQFNWFASANVSFNKGTVIYQDEVYRKYPWMQRTGQNTDQVFGYVAEGLFQSKEEIAGHATIDGYTPVPGDIKYKDLNGDGVINQFDQQALAPNKPLLFYGLNFGFNWRGFDFSALLQGVQNRRFYLTGPIEWEFQNNGKGQAFEHHLDRWTPATAATATYPRLSIGTNPNNHVISSFWIQNGDYFRLKNVELGYSLPSSLVKRAHINGVRVFVNGMNLLTSKRAERTDPETVGGVFPLQKVYNAGINIKL
ncbi:MAG TPA: SusC/RagA family TonB-linked outer membrane protein [Chitinophaga sp.]|uniref:SusC/RagA family TonB-linked outer membrane protein n=1 Tax=Chitinophaga sp. TaxID=1869181 RepID=UPI002B535F83|nr:SusC/RagA family TonB-linked outer membrane protein [Chitinophaga sp.]HVI45268.1 SusC/RagA family TonB-linked outer membrane protein [Chitinophaga sp.]